MSTRRSFINRLSLGSAVALSAPSLTMARPSTNQKVAADAQIFPIGFAGYSFLKFDLDQSIKMMQRLGVNYLSLKDFHLPLNSNATAINAVKNKLQEAGINLYTVGVVYMRTKEAVDQAFAYAQSLGVKMIVGVPNEELLAYTEGKVKEYDIKLAIHNHGPEDKLYPSPKSIYDLIKKMDTRMGLCIDIGHTFRAGVLPEQAVVEYGSRLFDLHIKDETAMEKDAKVIEVGRGKINFSALVTALRKIKYAGVCSIEYEKDMTDPIVGMAESVGYFKGVMSK